MGSTVLERIKQNGFELRIEFDETPPVNPLEDYGFELVSFHKRYYTDKQYKYIRNWHIMEIYDHSTKETLPQAVEQFLKRKELIYVPVYMYEHSGCTVSSTPFDCNWDSGQLGFLYQSKKWFREEWWGKHASKYNQELVDKSKKILIDFIEDEFNAYISGEYYWFCIEDEEGEVVDSCGGYTDSEHAKKDGLASLQTYQLKLQGVE